MWWRTVLVFHSLAIIDISTQLDNNGTEAPQCCPCPTGGADAVASPAGLRGAVASPGGLGAAGAGLEHCPCLARDADAEGAASMLFPNAVRAFGNVVRPDPKEDAKPLLHPEVDLASSVLETLREATDEEYRDALERDAARASAPDWLAADAFPEDRNVVTIIVSPQNMDRSDDVISEASHVQETRCIHPSLGNSRASFNYRPSVHQHGLEEILNLPLPGGLLHRQRDSNLAASDVSESVVKPDINLNRLLSGLKLRADQNKNTDNMNSLLTNRKSSTLVKNVESNVARSPEKEEKNVLRENLAHEDCTNILAPLNNDADTQTSSREVDVNSNLSYFDSNTSPSNVEEQIDIQNIKNPSQKHFPLKNLFKLRDVELIPLDSNKKIPKSKLFIPDLRFETFQNNKDRTHILDPVKIPTLKDLFGKPSKVLRENDDKQNNDIKSDENSGHIQTIPKRKEVTTEILDTVPSPSEINPLVRNGEDCIRLNSDPNNSANNANVFLDTENNETVDANIDTESDSLTDGDFSNSDLESAKDTESNEETQNNKQSTSEDCHALDDIPTMDRNSDSEILIISSEEISDVPQSSIDFSELNEPDEKNKEAEVKHPTLRTLEEIRKSVVEKLDALQVNNRNVLDNIRQSMEEISERSDSNGEENDVQDLSGEEQFTENDPNPDFSPPTTEIVHELGDSSAEEISFAKLQSMSDSILEASENNIKEVDPARECREKDTSSDELKDIETGNVLGVDEIEQMQSKETEPENGINTSLSNSIVDQDGIMENNGMNLCPSDLVREPSTKGIGTGLSGNQDNVDTGNDLETLASEPLVNSILRPNSKSLVEHLSDFESKLRQNIVQPSSLINTDSLNIFRAPTLSFPDISELDTNIPTLDEVRARVSEILSGLARQSEDEEVSSELDSDDFASNVSPMLSNPLQPLEDINLDIIQLKPIPLISNGNPLKAALPGLNLNTYKAKLAVPKSLDLKPLNLASTLGSGGGLVGARLSIVPEKDTKNKKSKGKFKNSERSWEKDHGRIGAKLADITARMHSNAQNLLNIPNKSLQEQSLQASNTLENIAENLKSETENSIRNLHKSINTADLSNTLSKTHLKDPTQKLAKKISKSTGDLIPGKERLGKTINTIPSIGGVVNNLLSHTESAMKSVQRTLSVPELSDIGMSIQKSAHNSLKSPITTSRNANLKNTLQTSLSLDNVVDNLKSQSQSTMRHIQNSLSSPILPDISTTMQKHAEDLLKSPITAMGRDTLGNSLKAPAPLDLKSADKAVKNLQKTLKATLRSSPVKDVQKLINPNNIIETITNHQEDVKDKLFAIHTDLNDRFESIHNDVMDPERLKSILSPPSNRNFELFSIPLPSSRMNAQTSNKQASPVMKTIKPTFANSRLQKTSTSKVSKPNLAATARASSGKERDSSKSFKMSKAASAPVPSRINRPLKPLNTKTPTLQKSSDEDSLKIPSLSLPNTVKGMKKPLLPKPKPLFENKIKVTFGPTTLRPIPLAPAEKVKPMGAPPAGPKASVPKRFKPKPPVRQPTPWSEWGEARTAPKSARKGDALTSPSQTVPRIKSPLRHNIMPIKKKTDKTAEPKSKSASRLGPLSSRLKTQPKKSLIKPKPQPNLKSSAPQGRASNRDSKLLSTDKPASLLSKLTEALKNKQTKGNLRSPGADHDAAPAPSNQLEKVVALDEPMKENVSYKCKMMCVKLD